jgi:hypothetical protein
MSDRVRAPVSAELAAELTVMVLIILVLPRSPDAWRKLIPDGAAQEGLQLGTTGARTRSPWCG